MPNLRYGFRGWVVSLCNITTMRAPKQTLGTDWSGLERSGADIGTEVFHPVVSCSMKGRFSYCVHYPDINCMK